MRRVETAPRPPLVSTLQLVRLPIEHSAPILSNNEPQHLHPPPRPRPPRCPSSPRRHPQALLPVPVCLARTTRTAETRSLATRSSDRRRRHLEARRLEGTCLADRATSLVETPAHPSSAQSPRPLPLLVPHLCLAARRQGSLWAARPQPADCLVGTKTRPLVQTKAQPQRPPHPRTSLEELKQAQLVHKHNLQRRLYSVASQAQHPQAKPPALA
jgi:hypothetical protein